METFNPPGDCPVCGEYVEAGRLACDSCGSCPETGWNEDTYLDGVDLPGDEGLPRSAGGDWQRWAIGVILILAVFYLFVLS